MLDYIIWNPHKVFFALGPLKFRWYSLLIICAFLGGRYLCTYFFKKEGRPVADVEELSFYLLFGCLLGARLGEVLFYSRMYYLEHPLEAILPVKFSPNFAFVGYKGLSYHGALIGGFVATFLYAKYNISLNLYPFSFRITKHKRAKQSFLWLLTPGAFCVMMGFLVRIGNFVNSEIVGTPTHTNYGVFFAKSLVKHSNRLSKAVKSFEILKDPTREPDSQNGYQPILLSYTFAQTGVSETMVRNFVTFTLSIFLQMQLDPNEDYRLSHHLYVSNPASLDYTISKNPKGQYVATIKAFAIPRHPVQLYESFAYLISLVFLFSWWNYSSRRFPDGMLCGLAAVICYTFRFFLEFFKDPFNILIKGSHPITMGHLLSLVTILCGVLLMIISYRYGRGVKKNELK